MNTLSLVNNEDIFNSKEDIFNSKEDSLENFFIKRNRKLFMEEVLEKDWLLFINSPFFGKEELSVSDVRKRIKREKKNNWFSWFSFKKENKLDKTKKHFHQHTAKDLKEIERLYSNPELEDLVASFSNLKLKN